MGRKGTNAAHAGKRTGGVQGRQVAQEAIDGSALPADHSGRIVRFAS